LVYRFEHSSRQIMELANKVNEIQLYLERQAAHQNELIGSVLSMPNLPKQPSFDKNMTRETSLARKKSIERRNSRLTVRPALLNRSSV